MRYWGTMNAFECEREVIRIPVRQINQAAVSLSGTDGQEGVEGGDSCGHMRQASAATRDAAVKVLEWSEEWKSSPDQRDIAGVSVAWTLPQIRCGGWEETLWTALDCKPLQGDCVILVPSVMVPGQK